MRTIDFTQYYIAKPDSIAEPDNMCSIVRVGRSTHDSPNNRAPEVDEEMQRIVESTRSYNERIHKKFKSLD